MLSHSHTDQIFLSQKPFSSLTVLFIYKQPKKNCVKLSPGVKGDIFAVVYMTYDLKNCESRLVYVTNRTMPATFLFTSNTQHL